MILDIAVGSTNPAKLEAVRATARRYWWTESASIRGYRVESGVPAQPVGLDQIFEGASNRARAAALQCNPLNGARPGLAIGLESGIYTIEVTAHQCWFVLDICAAVLMDQDGKVLGVGQSSGFEVPEKIMQHVEEGGELGHALSQLGLEGNQDSLKHGQGVVGVLTRGRVTRQEQVSQALVSAFARIDCPEHYS